MICLKRIKCIQARFDLLDDLSDRGFWIYAEPTRNRKKPSLLAFCPAGRELLDE